MIVENFPEREFIRGELPHHLRVVDAGGGRQIVFLNQNGEIEHRVDEIFYTMSNQMNQLLVKAVEDICRNNSVITYKKTVGTAETT